MRRFIGPFLDAAADLCLGAACPGCGRPAGRLCLDCRQAIRTGPVAPGWRLACAGLPLWSAGLYAGPLAAVIVAAKDGGRQELCALLGERLAQAVQGLAVELDLTGSGPPLSLVPVPSAAAAVRRRGFDFGLALARRAASRLAGAGLRTRVCPVLTPTRAVADQSGLDAARRRANLDQAWRARPGGLSGHCLVLDDIVTTGASLAEASRALRAAGQRVWGAATVAATADLGPARERGRPQTANG
ncbi:MAG: ComF family protein [Propionibacteriaceae bacterium]|nr:ComF family protein [Propionibacteriaceae bacterium]